MASRNTDYYQIETIHNNGQSEGYISACFFISIQQYLESIGHSYSVQQLMDLAEYSDRNIDFQTGELEHLISLNKLIKALTIRLGRPIRINVHQPVPNVVDINNRVIKNNDGIINNPDRARVESFLQFGPRGSLYNIDIYQTNYTHYELIVNMNEIQLVDTTRIATLNKSASYNTDIRRKPIEPIQRPYADTDGISIDNMLRPDRASFARQPSEDIELSQALARSRLSRQPSEDSELATVMSLSRDYNGDELSMALAMSKESMNTSKCNIPDSQKNICGDYKTSQSQCTDMKCCWKENKYAPKCYFPVESYSPVPASQTVSNYGAYMSKPQLSDSQKMDRLINIQRNIEDLENEREQYRAAFGGINNSEYEITIDRQIDEYNREIDRLFQSKYLKYKNKYITLRKQGNNI